MLRWSLWISQRMHALLLHKCLVATQIIKKKQKDLFFSLGGNIEAAANWALTEGMNLGNEEVLDNEANVIPSSIGNERGEESDFQGSAFAADVKEIREEEPASKIVRPKPINCFGNHSEALDEEFSNPEVVPTVERKKQAAIPVEENNTSEMVSFKGKKKSVCCFSKFLYLKH